MGKTYYGDEDPEMAEDTAAKSETELFETAKHMGWNPDDMLNKEFAAKYKKWLESTQSEEGNADRA
jgi:hypothetical protein